MHPASHLHLHPPTHSRTQYPRKTCMIHGMDDVALFWSQSNSLAFCVTLAPSLLIFRDWYFCVWPVLSFDHCYLDLPSMSGFFEYDPVFVPGFKIVWICLWHCGCLLFLTLACFTDTASACFLTFCMPDHITLCPFTGFCNCLWPLSVWTVIKHTMYTGKLDASKICVGHWCAMLSRYKI